MTNRLAQARRPGNAGGATQGFENQFAIPAQPYLALLALRHAGRVLRAPPTVLAS